MRDLTDGGESVYGGVTLGKHSVCGELGKLERPEADSQDLLGPNAKSQ